MSRTRTMPGVRAIRTMTGKHCQSARGCSERSPLHDVRKPANRRETQQLRNFVTSGRTSQKPEHFATSSAPLQMKSSAAGWWSQTGSNRRPPACKAGALPTELWPQTDGSDGHARRRIMRIGKSTSKSTNDARSREVVGLGRLELPTSRLSSARSNQLSYKPLMFKNRPNFSAGAPYGAHDEFARGPREGASIIRTGSSKKKEKRRRRCPANG
jgi:hypothetical protein